MLHLLLVDNALFDASQYAFFGKGVMEEVELGCIEDNGGDNAGFIGIDVEYHFSTIGDREEVISFGAQECSYAHSFNF